MKGGMIDKELLEKDVTAGVYTCWYYDLPDTQYQTPNNDLQATQTMRVNVRLVVIK